VNIDINAFLPAEVELSRLGSFSRSFLWSFAHPFPLLWPSLKILHQHDTYQAFVYVTRHLTMLLCNDTQPMTVLAFRTDASNAVAEERKIF
jgi:hypothetical protein